MATANGPTPGQLTAGPVARSRATGLTTGGTLMQMLGAFSETLGAFYSAKSAQYQFDSRASSLEFQADLSQLNARRFEDQAQAVLGDAQQEMALLSLRAGQEKAAQRVSAAARGVRAGGSAAEVLASTELVKRLDRQTIGANAVRRANAARAAAVNAQNQATLQRASAANLRRTSRSIRPGLQAATSLLGSAARFSSRARF